jgi:ribosomal protein S18 acetylase RimI-like enzyme
VRGRGQLTQARLRIRRAIASDRPFLEDVHVAALGPVALVGYGWTAERLRAQFRREVALESCFVIAVTSWPLAAPGYAPGDPRDAGYISIENRATSLYIDAFAIAPRFQRHGIGAAAMRVVLEDAGGTPVRLTVLRTNRARSLYLRLGFRIVGGDAHREHMEWQRGA